MSMNIVKIGFIALLFSLVSCAEKHKYLILVVIGKLVWIV